MKKHLFVCGCARSGTSALVRALNEHPEIAIGMERYINRFSSDGVLRQELFEVHRFFSVKKGDTHYQRYSEMRVNVSRKKYVGATYVGDKIPRLYRNFAGLFKNFPSAKVLFLLRTPLSVAASFENRAQDITDHLWSRERGACASVTEYNESLKCVAPYIRSGQVMLVPYERVFFDGHGWEKIARFLELGSDFPIMPKSRLQSKISNLNSATLRFVREKIDWETYENLAASIHSGSKRDFYSEADKALISYSSTPVPGFSIALRDPSKSNTICLGSAATFGRFVEVPYSKTIKATNFGIGGARPESFLYEPIAISRIAQAKATVVEMMSARGYANPAFEPKNRFANMVTLRPECQEISDYSNLPDRFFVDRFWQYTFRTNVDWALQLVEHCQKSWLRDMKELLSFSKRPILFWFSQKKPPEQISNLSDYSFPHFITQEMINQLDAEYVELVSSAGIPYKLINANGDEVSLMKGWPDPTVNSYYPSQEMHDLAAVALRSKIQRDP